jgi:hypothetical protein
MRSAQRGVPENEAEHIACLAKRAQDPDVQALVASWGPLTPEQLALVARVFGNTGTTSQHAAAA